MTMIQMSIDDALLKEIDRVIEDRNTSRSDFINAALQQEIQRRSLEKREAKHVQGYLQKPVTSSEFNGWEFEQVWDKE